MANRIASLISFLRAVVEAFRTQQSQIADLQARVASLEGHAETVSGETGIKSQLGDLNTLPDLEDELAAAMPAPADTAASAEQQTSLEPQQAAA